MWRPLWTVGSWPRSRGRADASPGPCPYPTPYPHFPTNSHNSVGDRGRGCYGGGADGAVMGADAPSPSEGFRLSPVLAYLCYNGCCCCCFLFFFMKSASRFRELRRIVMNIPDDDA